ncbi:MAG: SDR family NAD(P)-dependent oxidoreductase, partial [Actinomycetota bacterium]
MSSSHGADLFSLADKCVLITGGAGLLGKVFSQALVDAGANLAIIDLNRDEAESAARQIRKSSKQRVVAIGCDITS